MKSTRASLSTMAGKGAKRVRTARVDAKGKPIRDARLADKNYGYLNYNTYGGSFCVKNRGIKVGNTYSQV